MADETTVWRGASSQLRNLHLYLLCLLAVVLLAGLAGGLRSKLDPSSRSLVTTVLLALALVPAGYALWRFVRLRSRQYEVTTERIRVRAGLLSKRTEEMELYRVKDHTLIEPFWQRLFGLGSILIISHDPTTPQLMIEAVPHPTTLSEEIRKNVEICRERKKVRMAELE